MKPPVLVAVATHGGICPTRLRRWPKLFCVFVMAFACGLSAAVAQYSIPWWKISAGGGASTGGGYSVIGAIGQPDAGASKDFDRFSVTGGFWALPVAVQVDGAPTLHIAHAAPGFAVVWWTPPSTNWVLQEALTLTSGWTNSLSGATNPVTVPIIPPSKFYRLFSP
jgi:hypothetical protein